MAKDENKPEDLGIKIGTKDEAAWTQIKKQAQADNDNNLRVILINKEVIKLANKMIQGEKGFFKKLRGK